MNVGIDLGGTRIKIGIAGTALRATIPTHHERGPADTIGRIVAAVRNLSTQPVTAVGLGTPGLVRDGVLLASLNMQSWVNAPLQAMLGASFECPAAVTTDVDCITLGEALHGGFPRGAVLVVITLGTGVGTGIAIGATTRGGGGGLVEIEPGVTLEDRLGASALLALASSLATPAASLEEVTARGNDGDGEAIGFWHDAGVALGRFAAGAALLTLADRVVVGGGVAAGAGDLLLHPARATFRQAVPEALRADLVASALGTDAGVLGAAEFASGLEDA